MTPARRSRAPRPRSLKAAREQATAVNELLAQAWPDAHTELDFSTPLELLVATVLSAQTTDVRVNQVTPGLFARYPDAADLAGAPPRGRSRASSARWGSSGPRRQPASGIGAALVERFGGEVPDEPR